MFNGSNQSEKAKLKNLITSSVMDACEGKNSVGFYIRRIITAVDRHNRKQRKKFADDICLWLDDLELKEPNAEFETWKMWKHIRNGIRDRAKE